MLDALFSLPSLGSLLIQILLSIPLLGLVRRDNAEVIETDTGLKGEKRVKLPEGRYEDIGIVIDADNKTGKTVTFDDLGTLRVLRNGGDQRWGFNSWKRQRDILDQTQHHTFRNDTTQGGTSTLETRLRNQLPGVLPLNAFHCYEDKEMILVLDFDSKPSGSSGLNALANSLTYKVVGYKNRALPESAQVVWESTRPEFTGSTDDAEIDNISGENVALIAIHDPDTVLVDVSLTRMMPATLGDEIVYDGAPIGRTDRQWDQRDRDFDPNPLHMLYVPETPQEVRNLGATLQLSVSGATSNMEVQYARLKSPEATGSQASIPTARTRLQSL